jgi:hypothetical protein
LVDDKVHHLELIREIDSGQKPQSTYVRPWITDEPVEACQPIHQWTYPACNILHEVQLFDGSDSMSFINCGGSRCAFRIHDFDGDPIVLKAIRFHSKFAQKDYAEARIDALAMERLTSSPYVTELFAGCGVAQLVEYSSGGNIHDLVKLARLDGVDRQRPLDRLKIAYQVATAVADIHTFEKGSTPSLTHNDLCCHQFILIDGVYKLADFHLSSFLRRNQKTQEVCVSHVRSTLPCNSEY